MIYKEIIWFDPNQATITSIVKADILKNVLKFIEHQSIHYTETFNALLWHLFDKSTTHHFNLLIIVIQLYLC